MYVGGGGHDCETTANRSDPRQTGNRTVVVGKGREALATVLCDTKGTACKVLKESLRCNWYRKDPFFMAWREGTEVGRLEVRAAV